MTIGNAKMIIYSWYRMQLFVRPANEASVVELSIRYEKSKGRFAKLISFLFADWYCDWCLKNMLADTKRKLSLSENSD